MIYVYFRLHRYSMNVNILMLDETPDPIQHLQPLFTLLITSCKGKNIQLKNPLRLYKMAKFDNDIYTFFISTQKKKHKRLWSCVFLRPFLATFVKRLKDDSRVYDVGEFAYIHWNTCKNVMNVLKTYVLELFACSMRVRLGIRYFKFLLQLFASHK